MIPTVVACTINAYYPKPLTGLYLRGNACGLNWKSGIQMTAAGNNMWTTTVNCDTSISAVEVKVLVSDKLWMLGANHHFNSDVGNTTEIYPWFYTTKGALAIIDKVYSKELDNHRDVIIYTPPSFYENTLKVHKNILIMHDGQNLFNPSTSAFGTAWMCQDALDQTIITTGTTEEVMIVGPYNTVDRNSEYTYIYDPSEGFGGKGDLYLDWISSTLIPTVASKYEGRVLIERDTLGILGSSLGGLISCYAGWTRSDIYGKVGCMSSSFWWDDQDYQNNVVPQGCPTKAGSMPQIYMDSGNGSRGERDCTQYTSEIYALE